MDRHGRNIGRYYPSLKEILVSAAASGVSASGGGQGRSGFHGYLPPGVYPPCDQVDDAYARWKETVTERKVKAADVEIVGLIVSS